MADKTKSQSHPNDHDQSARGAKRKRALELPFNPESDQSISAETPTGLSRKHRLSGIALHKKKLFVEALQAFDSSLQAVPDDSNTLLWKSFTLEELGLHKDALSIQMNLLQSSNERGLIYAAVGNLFALGRFKDALNVLGERPPRELVSYFGWQGLIFLRLNRVGDALTAFAQIFAEFSIPDGVFSHETLHNALIEISKGRYGEAVRLLNPLRIMRQTLSSQIWFAYSLFLLRNYQDALQSFESITISEQGVSNPLRKERDDGWRSALYFATEITRIVAEDPAVAIDFVKNYKMVIKREENRRANLIRERLKRSSGPVDFFETTAHLKHEVQEDIGKVPSVNRIPLDKLWLAVLDAEAVPAEFRSGLVERFRIEIARIVRPKWVGRIERGGELATLTAPKFLKRVHAAEISSDGIVSNETIRAIDPELMKAVELYVSKRRERNLDLGDAIGLQFVLARPRKPEMKGKLQPARRAKNVDVV